jgi:gas vesicle protein
VIVVNKLFGFMAGIVCGAVVGAAASLIFSPGSGRDLKAEAVNRWEAALTDARAEMLRTQQQLQSQFEAMRSA